MPIFGKILILFFGILFLSYNRCQAAFIVKTIDTNNHKNAISKLIEPDKTTYIQRVKKSILGFIYNHDDHYHFYEYEKKLSTAAWLCFPYTGGLLGIGRFYLGYNWQGLVQLMAFILALLLYLFKKRIKSSIIFFLLATIGVGFALCFIWEIVDVARILLGTLRPKYGGWR